MFGIASLRNEKGILRKFYGMESTRKGAIPVCEELGIGFVAYSPLRNGFLSGQYSPDTEYPEGDFHNLMGRFKLKVIKRNQALPDLIVRIADEKNATSAQIVLAWKLTQRVYIVPILGTRKLHRLEENIKAVVIILSAEGLVEINEALTK